VLLVTDAQSAGASGAVFGLMGASVVLFRARGLSLMESGLGFWLGLNLLITFAVPGISIGGHLGGLAGGLLAGFVLLELGERGRVSTPVAEALCGAIGVGALVAAIAAYGG
jgi:membrane associated rhomboid family serine protease